MKVICTFLGKHGDCLWALPTVRAISEHYGTPVDFLIGERSKRLIPLIAHQPYIASCLADDLWKQEHEYDHVFSLAYQKYTPNLPESIYQNIAGLPSLDLHRPWITIDGRENPCGTVIGFTDEYFAMKSQLAQGLEEALKETELRVASHVVPPGSRWVTQAHHSPCDWLTAARLIQNARVFLGDCSALHVLAVGLGTPVVIVEPNEERLNPIFYPFGKNGPQVTCVDIETVLQEMRSRHA